MVHVWKSASTAGRARKQERFRALRRGRTIGWLLGAFVALCTVGTSHEAAYVCPHAAPGPVAFAPPSPVPTRGQAAKVCQAPSRRTVAMRETVFDSARADAILPRPGSRAFLADHQARRLGVLHVVEEAIDAHLDGDEDKLLFFRMPAESIQAGLGSLASAAEKVKPYITQRIGSADLSQLMPLKHELQDVIHGQKEDILFSYNDEEVSSGLVNLMDFERSQDAAHSFNELSALHELVLRDVSSFLGWSTGEEDNDTSNLQDVGGTILGSTRLHASAQIMQDAKLAEEQTDGETFFGSRRLAAISLVLQQGVDQTLGAAAGASEMARDAAGGVIDAVGGAAGAMGDAVGGAAGAVGDAVGGAAGAVGDAMGGAAGAVGGAVAGAAGLINNGKPATKSASTPAPSKPTLPPLTRGGTRVSRTSATPAAAAASKSSDTKNPLPKAQGFTKTLKQKKAEGDTTCDNVVSQTVIMDAKQSLVYAVVTDLLHYQDWSGDGIAEIKIRKTDKKRTEVEYKAGAFGYMFDFSLVFWFEPQSLVRFELLESSMVKRMEGAYSLRPVEGGKVEVDFEVLADINRVPMFIQRSLANLVIGVALGELKKYVTTERCEKNLKSYGLLPIEL